MPDPTIMMNKGEGRTRNPRNRSREQFERASSQYTPPPVPDTGNRERDVFEANTREQDDAWVDLLVRHHLDVQRYVEPKIVMQAYREAGAFDLNYDEIIDSDDPVIRAEQQHRADAFARDYVTQFEDTWATYRGRIPFEFFEQFDFEDLMMLPMTVPPEIMEELYEAEVHRGREAQLQAQIEARTEQILRQNQSGDAALGFWSGVLSPFTGGISSLAHNLFDGEELSEEAAQRLARKQAEDEIFGRNSGPTGGFWSGSWDLVKSGWNSAYNDTFIVGHFLRGGGNVISAGGDVLGWAAGGILKGLDNLVGSNTSVEAAWERDRERAIEAANEVLGSMDEIEMAMSWDQGRRAWDALPEEEKQLWVEEHGGEIQAMGFFIDEHAKDPEAKEQMAQLVDRLTEQQRETIKQMEEGHFQNKTQAMAVLSAWGEFTEDIAIGVNLLMFDDLARSKALDFKAAEFMDEIRKVEGGPSEVLGWEGTALGLAYDVGTTMMGDPTTYIFGTGAVSALGRGVARSGTQVMTKVASPPVQSLIKNVAAGIRSGSRSTVGAMTMAGLDSIGQTQLLQLVRSRAQTLKPLWRESYQTAADIAVEKIAHLVPTELIGNATKAKDAILKRGGLKRPVEVIMDSNGNVALNQYDASAVRAVIDMGEEFVPVRVRRVDDIVDGGYTVQQTQDMRTALKTIDDLPDEARRTSSTEFGEGSQNFQAQITEEKITPQQDVLLGEFEMNGETFTVRKHVEPARRNLSRTLGDSEINVPTDELSGGVDEIHYALNSEGQLAGFYDGAHLVQAPGHRSLLHRILEVSEQADSSFLPRLTERFLSPTSSFSTDGVRFLENAIKRRLGGKQFLDEMDEVVEVFDGRQLWGDAFSVPDEIGANLSPLKAFDDSFVIDPDVAKEVEKIFTGSLMRTGRLKGLDQAVIARGMRSMVENIAKIPLADKPINWLKRMFTQHNLTTVANLSKQNGTDEALQYTMRLWGSDTANAEKWMDQIANAMYGKRGHQVLASKLGDDVTRLENELNLLQEQIGGNPYSSMSDDAFKRIIGETEDLEKHLDDLRQRVLGSEKASDPGDWSAAEKAAYDAGDWEEFSRLRGYTDEELADFRELMTLESRAEPDMLIDYPEGSPLAGRQAQAASAQEIQRSFEGVYTEFTLLRKESKRLAREIRRKRTQQLELIKETPSYDDVYKIMDDMIDDFNRQHIASKKFWKDFVDPQTGLVPRDLLIKGMRRGDEIKPGYVEDYASFADIAGVEVDDMNKLYRTMRGDVTRGYDFGVSPLDLAVASEWGGARYTQFTHLKTVHNIRQTMNSVINVWMIDKVFRPSTAAVVSIDEQMRILHLYGREALQRWLNDKAINIPARIMNQFQNPGRLGTALADADAVAKGVKSLPASAQERIRALEDIPDRLKQAERSFHDMHGIGWTDVMPDDPDYIRQAQRWSNQFIENPMFRSFLNGKDDFARWWNSTEGVEMQAKMQSLSAGQGGKLTSRTPTMEEAYKGWETMWDTLRANVPKAELEDWTNAWKEAARRTAESGRPHTLPGHLFDDGKFIPVRGAQKSQKSGLFGEWTEAFFDRLFMDPVQYRRGFIAEMVRNTERKRLTELYATQGKSIVPDSQLAAQMRRAGWDVPDTFEGQQLVQRMWVDSPFVPESYVTEIIEDAVVGEIENVLYRWNMGSRAGAMVKPIFPFGKPYADMIGFWGRETLKQPVLRGAFTQDNYLNLQSIAEILPFNPRPAAMISRLAATDMKIDKGWIPFDQESNEGLLPGSSETDISPMFFLPTEGEDIIGATLPGMGYLPLIALDMVLQWKGPDPVEEPLEYQQWVDNLSYVMPYFEYQQGGSLSRIFGGGTFATSFSVGADLLGFTTGQTFYNVTSELGDIGREIRRNREIGVLLSDPEVLAHLAQIDDEEALELYLNGLIDDANKAASSSHFAEAFGRFGLPARSKFDTSSHELQDVWIGASERFEDILGTEEFDPDNKDQKRQAAADIRTRFFDLPSEQRDLLVAAYPQLAVNLVSSWEWTPKGVNAGFPGTSLPYSSGGAPDDLVRHDYYVTNGFVRPIQPAHRARLIIGQVAEARSSVIKNVYETVAHDINDFIWDEIVSQDEEAMGFLEILQEDFGEQYGTADARQLWSHFYTLEKLIAKDAELVDEDGEPVSTLGFPQELKPWSTTWPGFEDASAKFGSLTLNELPESVQQAIEVMGLDVEAGMTGEQFHRALAEELATNQSMAYAVYEANWRAYGQERLAFSQSGDLQLTMAMYNTEYDEGFRRDLRNWNLQVEMAREEFRDSDKFIPAALRQELVDEFNMLVHAAKDKNGNVPWDFIWDSKFKGTLGPRDWTPPEPAPVFIDGVKNAHAMTPFIRDIIDGDTIVFSEEPGGDLFEVRLLGVDSREFATDREGALEDTERLEDFLERAEDNGDTIYLVRDPERYATNTDRYGRMLAWLWAGDEAFYFVDEMNPKFTPSGAKE